MKAIIKLAFCSLLALNATISNADNSLSKTIASETVVGKTKISTQQQANTLVKRVYEIRKIDINTLSKAEKSDLRNELLNIQEQLNNPAAGGIYISAGALILIIILLIILF